MAEVSLKDAIQKHRGKTNAPTGGVPAIPDIVIEAVKNIVTEKLKNIEDELRPQLEAMVHRILKEYIDKGIKGDPGQSTHGTDAHIKPEHIAEGVRQAMAHLGDLEQRVIAKFPKNKTPSKQEIARAVLDMIPPVDMEVLSSKVKRGIIADLPVPEPIIEKQLKISDIEGLEKYLNNLGRSTRERAREKMIHGGGASIRIGSVTPGILTYVREENLALQGTGSTFTLAHTPLNETTKLYRGGARQQSGASNDYTRSGDVITLTTPLVSGESLIIDYVY